MELFEMLKTRVIIPAETAVKVMNTTVIPSCSGILTEPENIAVISGTAETEET